MKVFVTGASGFVGSAVVKELLNAGHEVLGLVRSEEAAQKLTGWGAVVYRGDLSDPESLKPAVEVADAVIHLGFIHDFSRFKEMCELDARVIETIGAALAGTQKLFIITSAVGVIYKTGLITESDRPENSLNPRVATENAADKIAGQGVRVAVVRLSPVVHDAGDQHGFIPSAIRLAKEKGASAVIGDGSNTWPAVQRQDVARLYRLALEKNIANATRYHAVAEEGIVFKGIAMVLAKKLDLPLISVGAEEAESHFSWFTHFARFNIQVSAAATRQLLNWEPVHATLLQELEGNVYFPAG